MTIVQLERVCKGFKGCVYWGTFNKRRIRMQNHLLEKLLEVQRELSHAKADAVNPHFKSQYVTYEDLWDYAKEALNKHDILIQQVSHECEVGACIETMLFGHGASLSTGKMIVRADKPTAQAFGSAVTYAKRYSLSMALGIGADKDDDANTATTGAKRGW